MTELEAPVYDGKESINQYMKRVEKFTALIVKDKYDSILSFINEWLKVEIVALSDFKNVRETVLLKDDKHNRVVVRKYCEIFREKFGVDLSVDEDTGSDEIKDMYVIQLLRKMLGLINYTLLRKEFNNRVLYTIKKK